MIQYHSTDSMDWCPQSQNAFELSVKFSVSVCKNSFWVQYLNLGLTSCESQHIQRSWDLLLNRVLTQYIIKVHNKWEVVSQCLVWIDEITIDMKKNCGSSYCMVKVTNVDTKLRFKKRIKYMARMEDEHWTKRLCELKTIWSAATHRKTTTEMGRQYMNKKKCMRM